MELKRDYSSKPSAISESDRRQSLFDEYQYFTPGLYPSNPPVIGGSLVLTPPRYLHGLPGFFHLHCDLVYWN